MRLAIGNKNYSSWSMRPWVLMRHFDLPFEEERVRFDSFAPDSSFKRRVSALAPTGKVPVLVLDGHAVWDTLAIAETLAERYPEKRLWPVSAADRARARSLCAEMHAGFGALRSHCPQNLEAMLPEVGARIWQDQAAVRADVARIEEMWSEAVQASGGPFLFGEFTIADAYYAPVVGRLRTYALPVSTATSDYMRAVWQSPGVAAFVREALAEADFLDFEEPYRQHR